METKETSSESYVIPEQLGRVARIIKSTMSTSVSPQTAIEGDSTSFIYSTKASSATSNEAYTAVLILRDTGIKTNGANLVFRKAVWNPEHKSGQFFSEVIPTATNSCAGLMSRDQNAKLNALPNNDALTASFDTKVDKETGKGLSTHDFNNEWLTRVANSGVYSRQDNNKKAVNGIFSLTTASTDSDIRKALTCYETGFALSREDLEYCASNNAQIWDEATQGFVQVTHNGGGMFNFMELSMQNYSQLPRLRFVCLRNNDSDVWSVTRNGQEERICYFSERPTEVTDAEIDALVDAMTDEGLCNVEYSLATTSNDGLMSSTDKNKLDKVTFTSDGKLSASIIPNSSSEWYGTQAQYNAISTKDPNTTYYIYEQ